MLFVVRVCVWICSLECLKLGGLFYSYLCGLHGSDFRRDALVCADLEHGWLGAWFWDTVLFCRFAIYVRDPVYDFRECGRLGGVGGWYLCVGVTRGFFCCASYFVV